MHLLICLFSLSSALDLVSIVNEVNTKNNVLWVAEVNPRFQTMTEAQFRGMNRAMRMPEDLKNYKFTPIRNDIPTEFDSSAQWPMCKTIDHIYDQGHCGSCWAMATFETLQDRFCVQSNGTQNPLISGQHITSCSSGSSGCNGGYPSSAFQWIQKNGVAVEECIPYQMGTCKHPGCSSWSTPKCNKTCFPSLKPIDTKYFVASHADIRANEKIIQSEIMTHGPVTAAFTVYEDFATYKSGVYHHVTGKFSGLHAIKIVGWGVQSGTNYWKVVNSWNTDWGMDGVFLIKRGTNECGIEGDVHAGTPKL